MSTPIPPQKGQQDDKDYSAGLIRSDKEFMDDVAGALFLKPDFSDVTLVAGRERFHAHRAILALRCEYFRAMLYGGLKESAETEIELKETNPTALRAVLKYIYNVEIDLSEFNVEEILGILRLAQEYVLAKFQEAIADYLKKILSVDIAFLIAETSTTLSLESLTECCNEFYDQHAAEVLKSKEFPILSLNKVMEMLSRDTFCAPEIDIFRALTGWIRTQPAMEPNQLLKLFIQLISENCLRLHLMSSKELATVRHSEIFAPISHEIDKFILDAIEVKDNGTGSKRHQTPGGATAPVNSTIANGTQVAAPNSEIEGEQPTTRGLMHGSSPFMSLQIVRYDKLLSC